jgi:hypothetical protein
LRTLDRILALGVAFLAIFTPLAFGSVHPWAFKLMEITICFLLVLWATKIAFRATTALSAILSAVLIQSAIPG